MDDGNTTETNVSYSGDQTPEVNELRELREQFVPGDIREVTAAELEEWLKKVAKLMNMASLRNKAAAWSKKIVESEGYETSDLMCTLTKQDLLRLDFPSGHATAIIHVLRSQNKYAAGFDGQPESISDNGQRQSQALSGNTSITDVTKAAVKAAMGGNKIDKLSLEGLTPRKFHAWLDKLVLTISTVTPDIAGVLQ